MTLVSNKKDFLSVSAGFSFECLDVAFKIKIGSSSRNNPRNANPLNLRKQKYTKIFLLFLANVSTGSCTQFRPPGAGLLPSPGSPRLGGRACLGASAGSEAREVLG